MRRRVLVVDDDAAILEVLEMRLHAMGFDVTATASARAALAAVEAGWFDVGLIDLRMDPVDGIALMEEIHRRQARLPVLIMTAHGTIETAVEAVQRGAFDYLTKPFVRDELRAKIQRALETRRWARDRERLLSVGETLASSGVMARILDAVAQAAVETTEAERCVVFQLEDEHLVPMASAGSPPPSWSELEAAAATAMSKGVPTSAPGQGGRVIVAAPLVVRRGPAGALVVETPPNVAPGEDDLELLALFSSQAAVAIRNTHELERLRSGALAALGRMAAQVAHEVKNPLAGLKLYARHLEDRLRQRQDEAGANVAAKIAATIDHLAAVVTDVTAFGRPTEVKRAPTAIHPLLDECISLARGRAPHEGIEIVRKWDPACPAMMVDGRELRKAFLNVMLNAIDAVGSGGRVVVETVHAPDTGTVTVTVEDNGSGMNEETLSRVFDLFYTTKPQGTGLGMAIVRSIVTSHGGQLTLDSVPGRGTAVRMRLPVGTSGEPGEVGGRG
jgi:signal transduction histidine kinase